MKIVVFGDMHEPWSSRRHVERALEHVAGASHVVQIGDLYDYYAFSRYPRSLNVATPKIELRRGRERAEWFWREVRRRAPQAKRYQLRGNHDDRMERRVLEALPALEDLAADRLQFDGVETLSSSREQLTIHGITFEHGHRKFGAHAPWNQRSTVTGHLHRGAVQMFRQRSRTFFELNVGWLGDEAAAPFRYTPNRVTHWTPGLGVIDSAGPRFVPLA